MTDDHLTPQERGTIDTVPLDVHKEQHPDVFTRIGQAGATLVLFVGLIALVVAIVVMLRSWCECPAVPR